jgi:hypothetical protein
LKIPFFSTAIFTFSFCFFCKKKKKKKKKQIYIRKKKKKKKNGKKKSNSLKKKQIRSKKKAISLIFPPFSAIFFPVGSQFTLKPPNNPPKYGRFPRHARRRRRGPAALPPVSRGIDRHLCRIRGIRGPARIGPGRALCLRGVAEIWHGRSGRGRLAVGENLEKFE